MFTYKQLEEMSRMDIASMDKSKLVDAKDVQIDTCLPKAQRMEKYLEQIKNPYCFRCGDMGVKIEFVTDAAPLQETLTKFLIRKKTAVDTFDRIPKLM